MTKIFNIKAPTFVKELTGFDIITSENDALVRKFIVLKKIEDKFDLDQTNENALALEIALYNFCDKFSSYAFNDKIKQKISDLRDKINKKKDELNDAHKKEMRSYLDNSERKMDYLTDLPHVVQNILKLLFSINSNKDPNVSEVILYGSALSELPRKPSNLNIAIRLENLSDFIESKNESAITKFCKEIFGNQSEVTIIYGEKTEDATVKLSLQGLKELDIILTQSGKPFDKFASSLDEMIVIKREIYPLQVFTLSKTKCMAAGNEDFQVNPHAKNLLEHLTFLAALYYKFFDDEVIYKKIISEIKKIPDEKIQDELRSYTDTDNNPIFTLCDTSFKRHHSDSLDITNFIFILKEVFEARSQDFEIYLDKLVDIAISWTITNDDLSLIQNMQDFFTDEILERRLNKYRVQKDQIEFKDKYEITRIAHILALKINRETDPNNKKKFLQELSEILESQNDIIPKALSDYNANFPFDFMIRNARFCEENEIKTIPKILKEKIINNFGKLKEFTKFSEFTDDLLAFIIRNFKPEDYSKIVSSFDKDHLHLATVILQKIFNNFTNPHDKESVTLFASQIFSQLAKEFKKNGYSQIGSLLFPYQILNNYIDLEEQQTGSFTLSDKMIADFRKVVFIGPQTSCNTEAMNVCRRIIEKDDDKYQVLKPMAYFVLYQYYFRQNNHKAAAENFMKFYKYDPEDIALKEGANKNIIPKMLEDDFNRNEFFTIISKNFTCAELLKIQAPRPKISQASGATISSQASALKTPPF